MRAALRLIPAPTHREYIRGYIRGCVHGRLQRWVSACIATLLLAAPLGAAERSFPMDCYTALEKAQAEELADFSAALEAKDGSFEADVRAQAIALAKKLDPSLKPKDAAKKPMAAEDQLSDKALRDAAAARDKAREDAEKADKGPQDPKSRAYPKPENARERLDALRFEMIADQTDFVAALSLDPDAKGEAALRQVILKSLPSLLGTPKWSCERALKERIAGLSSMKYAPWTGTWTTRLGEMTIEQNDAAVTGSWKRDPAAAVPDGTFTGTIKDRVMTGAWRSDPDQGTLVLTLSRSDVYWKGITKQKSETHPIEGQRVGSGTLAKPDAVAKPDAPAKPEKAK